MKKIQNLVIDGMVVFIALMAITVIGSIVFAVVQCFNGAIINPAI
jgi:hypothetical protein